MVAATVPAAKQAKAQPIFNMATKKPIMSKTKTGHTAKAREPKNIKPPAPRKPVKSKAQPRSTNSKTGALGATSAY